MTAGVGGAVGIAAPTRAWTVRFALVWLGLWAAQLVLLQLADVDPAHKVRDFGQVNGAAGLAELVATPTPPWPRRWSRRCCPTPPRSPGSSG